MAETTIMYLNCKSYFSFRWGVFGTEELVKAGADAGATAMALTNINNTCDAWDFVQYCQQQGIKPILGAEIRNGDTLLYVLLAANNRGFAWINEFISSHLQQQKPFPALAAGEPFFHDLWDGFVIYPLGAKEPAALYTNERIGIQPVEVNKLHGWDMQACRDKLVIRQPVTFRDKTGFNVHRLLRAIANNVLLSKLPAASIAATHECLMSPSQLFEAFKQYPFIITNTYQLMDACTIKADFSTDKNKKIFSASAEDDRVLLAKLARDGMHYRYGKKNKAAMERVQKELGIIDQLGFNTYFLFTWDILRYARSKGYYYVGRGSGANSIVAYCLQITDVDPIELDLYFERFLNPHRSSPPDFDLDFSWLDRDDVIDYIMKRYGKHHASLLGCYSTFQFRAVVRELGKVFGLPKEEIDQLARREYGDRQSEPQDHIHRLILQYGNLIHNFPNHLSIHAGGILISEKPIYHYTATFMPPKGFPTTQIDMFIAENVGLHKLDVLSQRGLGHIKEAIRLVRQNRGVAVNIDDTAAFKKDPLVRQQIKVGNTIGCFYIESPAMRHLLKKLRCDDYITLVAASSIIRPGVAQSGMMREYIYRYNNPGKFQYLHPIMEKLLKETFGVMVFQEDVIKVAHYFAGLDLGEADVLRRAMSGKYRSSKQFELVKQTYFANCKKLGHPDELAKEIWRQMESFAGYSFSKAHSASYAVESFQSLYLKTYYPMEFMVAVINNFGGFYSRELYFYELMKTGAVVHAPCVNNSDYFTGIRGRDVHVGFVHIKSLEKRLAETIIEERVKHGPYLHLQDLVERTGARQEQLNILVSIGALRFTGKKKKELLWEANFLQKKAQVPVPASRALFTEKPISFTLPELNDHPLDDLYDQVEILDFPLCNPFAMADDDPGKYPLAKDLVNYIGKKVTVLIYFIAYKVVPTVKQEVMSFGTFLDAALDWIDTVHFPDSFRRQPLQGRGFYRITGKVIEEFGVCSVEVHQLTKVGYKERKYTNL